MAMRTRMGLRMGVNMQGKRAMYPLVCGVSMVAVVLLLLTHTPRASAQNAVDRVFGCSSARSWEVVAFRTSITINSPISVAGPRSSLLTDLAAAGSLTVNGNIANCGTVASHGAPTLNGCPASSGHCGCTIASVPGPAFDFNNALFVINSAINWANSLRANTITFRQGRLVVNTALGINVFDFEQMSATSGGTYNGAISFFCTPNPDCSAYTGLVVLRHFDFQNVNGGVNPPGNSNSAPLVLVTSGHATRLNIDGGTQAIYLLPSTDVTFNRGLVGAVYAASVMVDQQLTLTPRTAKALCRYL